jgi:hypothetical protein
MGRYLFTARYGIKKHRISAMLFSIECAIGFDMHFS